MVFHGDAMWKDNICQNFLEKNVFSIGTRGQKRSSFLQNCLFFSRKYPEAEKLEQLEQNRKKAFESSFDGLPTSPYRFSALVSIQG